MKLWKVQKFFGDVVYDLRSRRLLPLAIGLLVAIIAVPILISRGSSSSPPPTVQPAAASAETAPEIRNAVVGYDPGIRDYKRRLNDLSPKDPFQQQVHKSASVASQLNSTAVTPTQPSSSTGTSGSASTSTGSSSTGGSETRTTHQVRYFHSVADLSVGEAGQPLTRHKQLKNFTPLPSETSPVLVYLGSTLDQKKAIFSVSKYADQFSGTGTCGPTPSECQLLVLTVGASEQIVYTADGKTYEVKINAIRRVYTKQPVVTP
jgi:hypothetical protein